MNLEEKRKKLAKINNLQTKKTPDKYKDKMKMKKSPFSKLISKEFLKNGEDDQIESNIKLKNDESQF